MKFSALILFALLSSVPVANANTFQNAYLSFDLPPRWQCVLEQTEFVCRSNNPGVDSREAIIILTAKEVGPMDSLAEYEAHLRRPRQIHSRSGQMLQSTIYSVEQQRINNHVWVNGFHFNSEVPNYYTRYLATTKDKIAILVTFSAHKLHFTKYSQDFARAIQSLRVIATKSLMSGKGDGSGMGGGILGGGGAGGLGGMDGFGDAPPEGEGGAGGKGGGLATKLGGMALLLGGAGLYLLLMGRKGKKKRRK